MSSGTSPWIAIGIAVQLAVACAPGDPAAAKAGRGGSADSGVDASTGSDATGGGSGRDVDLGAYPTPFVPSNVGLYGMDLSHVADASITASGCDLFTEKGEWSCLASGSYAHAFVQYANGSKLSVFIVKSLRIEAGVAVRTNEIWPAIVIALGDMRVLGSIEVTPGTLGGGVTSTPRTQGSTGSGGFGGGGVQGGDTVAGEGASYCGLGGQGGVRPGASAGPPRAAYGSVELSPLLGGSSGGSGDTANTGSGGGAIQLVAGGVFVLAAGAIVSASGGGGAAGGTSASGGGSGGSILIEASSVEIDGTVAANGGGGGQGTGASGEDGQVAATPATGGAQAVAGSITGRGGDGGAAQNADASDGASNASGNPGAGGGGAGRIRINTASGAAVVTGIVTPASETGCYTIGKVG